MEEPKNWIRRNAQQQMEHDLVSVMSDEEELAQEREKWE